MRVLHGPEWMSEYRSQDLQSGDDRAANGVAIALFKAPSSFPSCSDEDDPRFQCTSEEYNSEIDLSCKDFLPSKDPAASTPNIDGGHGNKNNTIDTTNNKNNNELIPKSRPKKKKVETILISTWPTPPKRECAKKCEEKIKKIHKEELEDDVEPEINHRSLSPSPDIANYKFYKSKSSRIRAKRKRRTSDSSSSVSSDSDNVALKRAPAKKKSMVKMDQGKLIDLEKGIASLRSIIKRTNKEDKEPEIKRRKCKSEPSSSSSTIPYLFNSNFDMWWEKLINLEKEIASLTSKLERMRKIEDEEPENETRSDSSSPSCSSSNSGVYSQDSSLPSCSTLIDDYHIDLSLKENNVNLLSINENLNTDVIDAILFPGLNNDGEPNFEAIMERNESDDNINDTDMRRKRRYPAVAETMSGRLDSQELESPEKCMKENIDEKEPEEEEELSKDEKRQEEEESSEDKEPEAGQEPSEYEEQEEPILAWSGPPKRENAKKCLKKLKEMRRKIEEENPSADEESDEDEEPEVGQEPSEYEEQEEPILAWSGPPKRESAKKCLKKLKETRRKLEEENPSADEESDEDEEPEVKRKRWNSQHSRSLSPNSDIVNRKRRAGSSNLSPEEEYRLMRDKNNIASRTCRAKIKQKLDMEREHLIRLEKDNAGRLCRSLKMKCKTLADTLADMLDWLRRL